jgi:signal transduction histidine kinase
MKLWRLLVFVMLASLLGVAAHAGDRGTPEEAKAMAIKAAEYLKQAGPETAFSAFNTKDAAWHDRDLWVFVWNTDGKCLFSGASPALIGKTLPDLKDADGIPMVRNFIAVKDAGWTDFKWLDPITRQISAKTAYIIAVGDMRVGVGAYK